MGCMLLFGTPSSDSASFQQLCITICHSLGLVYRRVWEKSIQKSCHKTLYLTHFPRKPMWTDLQ